MKLCPVPPVQYENSQNYIYRVLRESIVRLHLKPGESISEISLQKEFNTSRSPIREAIIRLVADNLLEVHPQRGTKISLIDKNYIKQSNFIRQTVEKQVLHTIFTTLDTAPLAKELHGILDRVTPMDMSREEERDLAYRLYFDIDIAFHLAIFNYIQIPETWEIIRMDNLRYDRFLNLYLIHDIDNNEFMRVHREMADFVSNRNFAGIEERLNGNIISTNHKVENIFEIYPQYFV